MDQSGITTTSYAASGLSTSKKYFWHVNASNTSGTSAYSSSFNFTTIAAPAGLVAAYAFDEGTGTTVSDKSGNNLTGTIVGATWTTGGKYGNALSFNGTTNYVDLGNPTQLQLTGSMTVSAWVNAAANPADDGQIIAKSDDNTGWQLKTTPDTGPETFGFAVSGSAGSHTQRYSTTVRSLSTWYHIAGTYDATGKTLNTYVNGVLNNGALSGTVAASQVNSTVNVNVGRRAVGTGGGYYFNGLIDEVRVYNRALSQAEIQTDMNTPLSTLPAAGPAGARAPAIALASPAMDEVWTAGSLQQIRWNSTGISRVDIQYRADGSGEWTAAVENLPASNGTYEWMVPGFSSAGVEVRILDTHSGGVLDAQSIPIRKAAAPPDVQPAPGLTAGPGSPEGRELDLSWLAPAERDVKAIDIQRADTSQAGFRSIAHIDVDGTSQDLVVEPGRNAGGNRWTGYRYVMHSADPGRWTYRVRETTADGALHYSDRVTIDLAASPEHQHPLTYALDQNYPNPFNPTTTIGFALPKDGRVTMEVYNVIGQRVALLLDEYRRQGYYTVTFDAHALGSGMYFYRMATPGANLVRKLMLVK